MRLSISQPDLLTAINRVRSVIQARSTIPVLSFLKLEADGETLAITATDLDIQARARVSVSVDAPGNLLIESAKVYDFVRRIPADREVIIQAEENKAVIKAGRSRATLATLAVDQFPSPRDLIDGTAFTLTVDEIKRILIGPVPAVSDEETRYYLCGVFMHTDGDELRGVATDGHKLIKKVIDAPHACSLKDGVIIPSKALNVLQKCLGDDDVEIEADRAAIRFSTPIFDLQSRLVDGKYPDYQRVIPTERDSPVTVHRTEALGVVERVASVTADDLRTLVFEHDADGIAVRTSKKAEAEASDIILAETNGEFPYVGFAQKKIAALLGSMEGDQVVFHFNDTGAPHVFIDPERPRDVHVLMPVRTQ